MDEKIEQAAPPSQPATNSGRFYKVQMKGWTAFDPSAMTLADIAERIERGAGFLTAIEVIKVADNVSGVDDAEIRERFETILAVERIVANVGDIPQPLREKLNTALAHPPEEKKQGLAA